MFKVTSAILVFTIITGKQMRELAEDSFAEPVFRKSIITISTVVFQLKYKHCNHFTSQS